MVKREIGGDRGSTNSITTNIKAVPGQEKLSLSGHHARTVYGNQRARLSEHTQIAVGYYLRSPFIN
jgi:hypothetical protein